MDRKASRGFSRDSASVGERDIDRYMEAEREVKKERERERLRENRRMRARN